MTTPVQPARSPQTPDVEPKPAAPKSVSSKSMGPKPAPVLPPDFDLTLEPSHQVSSTAVRKVSIQDRPDQMDLAFGSMNVSKASMFLSAQSDS